MNATLLAYSRDSKHLLQANETGEITIHTIHTEDGSPCDLVFEYFHHKEQVILLQFLSENSFISISEKGDVRVVNFVTGKEVAKLDIKDAFRAASSPEQEVLFILQSGKGKQRLVRKYSLPLLEETGMVTGEPGRFYVPATRLLAISANECLLQYLYHELGNKLVREIVGIADFIANTMEVKEFERTIISDFNRDKVPFAVHPQSRIGARLDFNQPVAVYEDGRVGIQAEIFDIASLETKQYVQLCGVKASQEILAGLKDNEQFSEQYQKTLEKLYKLVMALKFSPDGKHLWVSNNMGALNVVDLETNERTRYIVNAGGTEKGVPTLNSIFALSASNNSILCISPDQRYVSFSYPNCFLAYDLPFQQGDFVHKLVPRQMSRADGVTEMPSFAGLTGDGKYLVFAHEAGYIFILDAATGKQQYRIKEPYITSISGVDHSDGRLMVAVSGSQAYCLHLEEKGETTFEEFFIPPHTIYTKFIAPEKVVFIHSDGAVVALDNEKVSMDVHFIDGPFESELVEEGVNEEEEEREDEPDQEAEQDEEKDNEEVEDDEEYEDDDENAPDDFYAYFDQHVPTFDGAVFRQGEEWKAATINEDGNIHVYSIAETVKYEYEHGSGVFYTYRHISASPSYLLVGNYSDYRDQGYTLFSILENGLKEVEKVEDKDLRFLCLKEREDVLLKFNQQTGAFTKTEISSNETIILFTYTGPAIAMIQYGHAADQLLFVEGSGRTYLIDLTARKIIYSWELKAQARDKQLVGVEPDASRFAF